jgi:hypothetical protein
MTGTLLRTVLCLGLQFAGQRTAEARTAAHTVDDNVRVAVVPPTVAGDVPPEVVVDIRRRLSKALKSGRYELVEPKIAAGTCTDYKCISSAAKGVGARYVVVPSIATEEHDYGIAIYVYDVGGARSVKRTTTCEICSYDEAVDALVKQAQDIRAPLIELIDNPYGDREQETDMGEGPPTLVVRTIPKGAVVRVNGEKVGTTPLSRRIAPGLVDLEVSKRGFATVSESVRATRGARTEVSYELVEMREGQTKTLRTVGITFSVLGVGMLGGGIPLLAIHENPYKKDCAGENIDYRGSCRFRYNTLVPGALLTAFGVGFLITGISTALVAFGRRNKAEKENKRLDELEEDTISVRPLIGPTSAGVRVRF